MKILRKASLGANFTSSYKKECIEKLITTKIQVSSVNIKH